MGDVQDLQYKKEHMHEFYGNGIHKKTGTEYDKDWFDWEWYSSIGFNRFWIDRFWCTVKWKNTEPFYSYDVEERKEKQKERRKEYKAQEKQEAREIRTQKNREIDRLETKLAWLRKEYKRTKYDDSLSEAKRDELLSKIYTEAMQHKKLIALYEK